MKSILPLGFLLKVMYSQYYIGSLFSKDSASFHCFSLNEHVQLENIQYTPDVASTEPEWILHLLLNV